MSDNSALQAEVDSLKAQVEKLKGMVAASEAVNAKYKRNDYVQYLEAELYKTRQSLMREENKKWYDKLFKKKK